jgi:protein-S-isoprenylcysteine O-methyltransferase Ste14
MRTVTGALLGSLLFFWIAPVSVAGWGPYLVSGWRMQPALLGLTPGRYVGGGLAAAGLAGLLECFARFAIKGRGTPAPIAPPERLVVSGLYRHVRNPMYVALVALVFGQALLFGSSALVEYSAIAWLGFHVFVVGYEEPALRRQFGASYDDYRAHVPRWWPRLTPWPKGAA